MKTKHKIVIGDSRTMAEVPDESVHLIVTSPPYWQLKDYGNGKQIGYNDSYEEYINNLNLVWKECHRVLHKGCRLCINIGDQFARSVYYGRYKVIPIRTEIIKFCESIGSDYMGAIIWQKVTTCNTTGGASVMGSFPYPRNGILKLDYEFILIFKKYGIAPKVQRAIKEQSKLTIEEWNRYFAGHWTFGGEKQKKHLAMFPEELPRRLIRMFSYVGDTVLDPFVGSGTTSLAARKLNRNSIGYEINEEYLPVIKQKVDKAQISAFEDYRFEINHQDKMKADYEDELERLPYIFKDPIKFDKKIDPGSIRFGSRISLKDNKSSGLHSVQEVISPEILALNGGLRIRLLGVKEIKRVKDDAIEFLKGKVRGQQVFLRFDEAKYDSDNNLYCYLYLKNKTFLNAHLIKHGLADVDEKTDFRHKQRFLEYRRNS